MKSRALTVPALLATSIVIAAAGYPLAVEAIHKDDPQSKNIHAIGESLRPGGVTDPIGWDTRNTDLAFRGKLAVQGRYDGFRLIDVSAPGKPKEIVHFPCVSDQGDVGIWGNLVFRAVNSPIQTPICQDELLRPPPGQPGFEGLQIFDISDVQHPVQIGWVAVDCGSHTFTIVPDLDNNRLLIYNSPSGTSNIDPSPFGNQCTAAHGRIDIVEVPLDDPAASSVIGSAALGFGTDGVAIRSCHDIGVILGSVNLLGCAGNPQSAVFDITDPANPARLYAVTNPGVTSWHSAAFTWDGKVLVLGWEPGGGTRPRCLNTGDPLPGGGTQTDDMKSLFFHDSQSGALLGKWVLPRPQSAIENCTVHNFNIMPNGKRYLLVHGSYQSGTSMVEFTDPANAFEVAYSDPPPLDLTVHPRGGVWSTYYYNNFIYESDATRGLRVYRVGDKVAAGTLRLTHMNPQTQEFSLP